MLPDWFSPRRRWFRAAVAVALVLTAALLLRWRESDLLTFAHTFEHVRWRWILIAIAFNVLSAAAGALAWHSVIKQAMPPPHPRFRLVLSAFSVGLLANLLLPGRAGEVTRIAVLARRLPGRKGIWATLLGTVFAYRVLDLVPSVVLVAYVLVSAEVPPWAHTSFLVVLALGSASLAIGFASARRYEHSSFGAGRVRSLVLMARQGLGVLRAPGAVLRTTLFQCLAWTSQLLAVVATMQAYGLGLPLSAAALVLVMVNLAILVPLWPGNVGLLQAAVALPLLSYGVDLASGLAFGVGLQAVEFSVGASLGLLFLAHEGLSLPALKRRAARAY